MKRERQNESEQGEKTTKQVVGLRLQDVILRSQTNNPRISELRSKIELGQDIRSETNERIATLALFSETLLGIDLNEALAEARKTLIPYRNNGERKKALIVSSASSASASQETECAILESRGHIIDIPGAIEGRDSRSAQDGDTALINTDAGLLMAKHRGGLKIIDLANEPLLNLADASVLQGSDLYYKADGLLILMLTNPNSPVLTQLVEEISNGAVVYPYNLDEETQIALLWLSKHSKLDRISVNANSPEVGVELTRKGFRYPKIEDALELPNLNDPYQMQIAEWKLSQAAKEIDYHPDFVPGYVVNRTEAYKEFYEKVTASLGLLATRYELEIAWIKPDRGTDGGNQGSVSTNIAGDNDKIEGRAQEMWRQGGNWVIEAKTNYFKITLPLDGIERTLMTTPSVHVIKGEPRYTISLQLVDGVAWGGNLICSQETWSHLVNLIDRTDDRIANSPEILDKLKNIYKSMPKAMRNYVDAINNSGKYKDGQVRGGADLAVATLGGKFGNEIMLAVQDYNARANGCETAYALYDLAQEIYKGKGEAITRNITPRFDFEMFTWKLPEIINEVNVAYGKNISAEQVKLIAVSAGWGQFGLIGTDPIEITQNILLLELQMRKSGLIR